MPVRTRGLRLQGPETGLVPLVDPPLRVGRVMCALCTVYCVSEISPDLRSLRSLSLWPVAVRVGARTKQSTVPPLRPHPSRCVALILAGTERYRGTCMQTSILPARAHIAALHALPGSRSPHTGHTSYTCGMCLRYRKESLQREGQSRRAIDCAVAVLGGGSFF